MHYGIRDLVDIKFYRFIEGTSIPATEYFVIDTAKTSTLESTTQTVYAQGGTGNARLMAWEGEKTLTFTIEDALFSRASLEALTGSQFNTKKTLTIRTDDFAGYYRVVASTLVRDEFGTDHPATVTIPKAKLQTALNIPMAPSGDPAAFTFTLDAFPVDKVLCEIKIEDDAFQGETIEATPWTVRVVDITRDGIVHEAIVPVDKQLDSDNNVGAMIQWKMTVKKTEPETYDLALTRISPEDGFTLETIEFTPAWKVITSSGLEANIADESLTSMLPLDTNLTIYIRGNSTWYIVPDFD